MTGILLGLKLRYKNRRFFSPEEIMLFIKFNLLQLPTNTINFRYVKKHYI